MTVTEQLADLSASQLPLASGLRAAAEESDPSLRAAYLELAELLEQGRSLEQALAATSSAPKQFGVLLTAAVRHGETGQVLAEMLEKQNAAQRLRRRVWAALAYPLVILVFAFITLVVLQIVLVRPMSQLFKDFELELPQVTIALIWFAEYGPWMLLAGSLVLAAIAGLTRLLGGPVRWRRILGTLPLFGVLWQWPSVVELCGWWAVLLEQRLPLPETLRAAADGVGDPNMSDVSRRLADRVESGMSLSDAIEQTPRLPPTLAALTRWGERQNALTESFYTACEVFEGRVQMRAEVIRIALPPVMLVLVGAGVVFMVFGLLWPIVSLLRGLM